MKTVLLFLVILQGFLTLRLFAQEADKPDTLCVMGKCVIFWEPDPVRFDSVSNGRKTNLEKLSDFRRYTELIKPFLKKKSMSYILTAQNVLKLRMNNGDCTFFRKEDMGDILGIVLTNGIHPPKLLPGVTPDSDFFLKYRNFFGKE